MRPFSVLFILAFGFAVAGPVAADAPPNIVLIVSDDQGYNDLGCFGSQEAQTPQLDALASGGVRLTNFYVTWPACTPSRGSLLTGRYPQRNGVYDMIRNEAPDYGHRYSAEEYAVTFERIGGMDTREILLPQLIDAAGYVSGIFGKWDLGVHRRYLPLQRGFDQFYGFTNTGIDYFTHERYGVPSMFRDNQPTDEDRGTYATDLFQREALRFLDQHHQRPFFLYLPFNAPHSASSLDPLIRGSAQATQADLDRYPALQAEAAVISGQRYGKPAQVQNRPMRRLNYLAAVTAMDRAIGEVLARIERYGLTDSTLVIFLSDNGGGGIADNGALRGHKGDMFEGGIRVPGIVRWPARLPAGTTCDAFLSTLEVVPTLLAASGQTAPPDLKLDGFNMLPALAGDADQARQEMYWQRRGDTAVRVGDWKWVNSQKGSGLFNLRNDVSEQHDQARANPRMLQQLQARLAAWQAEMQAAEPRGPFRDF